jgi:hypothetical protein
MAITSSPPHFNIGATATPGDANGFIAVMADDTVIVFLNGHELNTPTGELAMRLITARTACLPAPLRR